MLGARPPTHVGADFADHRQRRGGLNPIDARQVYARELVEVGARIEARLVVLGGLPRFGRGRGRLHRDLVEAGQILLNPLVTRRNLGVVGIV